MGLNHLQSLICTYSADDLRPLMIDYAIFLFYFYLVGPFKLDCVVCSIEPIKLVVHIG